MRNAKICLTLFITAMLLASFTMPALADQGVSHAAGGIGGLIKNNIAQNAGTSSQLANNSAAGFLKNGSATVKPKIGNLQAPPKNGLNVSRQPFKNAVDDYRLKIAKSVAEARIKIVIQELELYKKKISASNLDEQDKAELISSADANIVWFRQKSGEIQAAGDMATLQALVTQVDQQIAQMKVNMKKGAGLVACDEMDAKIAKAADVSRIAGQKIDDLKAKGKNTAQLEAALASYDGHVSAAGQHAAAARAAFEGITSASNTDRGFIEGLKQLRLAEQELNKAYSDLKRFYWYFFRNGAAIK